MGLRTLPVYPRKRFLETDKTLSGKTFNFFLEAAEMEFLESFGRIYVLFLLDVSFTVQVQPNS